MGSSILASLLALSYATLDSRGTFEWENHDLGVMDHDEDSQPEMKVLSSAAIVALTSVQRFLELDPTSWQSPFKSIELPYLNSALGHESYGSIRLAIAWVFLRLGMPAGLSSPVTVPG